MPSKELRWSEPGRIGLLIPGIVLLGLLAGGWTTAQPLASTHEGGGIQVIVLDPGHGGPDGGGRGPTGLSEKDIVLQVAQEAARLIEQHLGLRAVLTRTDDAAISLETRAALANQAGGHLFISIHAGGSFAAGPYSFQTFYLHDPPPTSPPAREYARAGSTPERPGQEQRRAGPQLQLVPWDQAQAEFLETSQALARMLQRNLRAQIGGDDRETQGLPLLVLRWVRMPAVLLDLGSLSDPAFESRVRDEAYLERVALAIAQTVSDYQALYR